MPKTLYYLILVSGNAGTSGQSFLSHVTSAASGAKMTDYNISAINFDTSGISGTYGTSVSISLPFTLTKGSRSTAIQQLGLARFGVNRFPVSGNFTGSSVSLTSLGSWTTDNSVGSLNMTITAPFSGTPTLSASAAFSSGGAGSTASDVSQRVTWSATLSSTATGTSVIEVVPRYSPDTGPYNDTLFINGAGPNGGFSITMTNRAYSTADYEYEWHTNSSYTALASSSSSYNAPFNAAVYAINGGGGTYSAPYDDASYGGSLLKMYLRWRTDPGSGWNNYGAVTFTDTRSPAKH